MDTSTLPLGRLPVKRDPRNFQMAGLISRAKFPASFDFDKKHPGVPTPMFCNDALGCCVMSARGHLTLREELLEQKKIISINDHEIMAEYYRETGGGDTGLAFAEIKPKQHDLVKQSIFALGCYIGVNLPLSSREELESGKAWTHTTGKGSSPGSWGGHCILVVAYTAKDLTCVTWGQKQKMSWAWFDKYCEEAYAVIDAVDTVKKRALINQKKLVEALKAVA